MLLGRLQALGISHMRLTMHVPYSAAQQRVWAGLRVSDTFHLQLKSGQVAVEALPPCKRLRIFQAHPSWAYDGDSHQRVTIMWTALTRHPGRVLVCMLGGQSLQIVGYSGVLACTLGPWQLVIHSTGLISGLPQGQATSALAACFMHNAAAHLAGWQNSCTGPCSCQAV